MEEKIKNIIGDVLELEENIRSEIQVDDDLTKYGMDSINAIEAVVTLEMEFDISIEEDDLLLENLLSISKMKQVVSKYLQY